MDESYDTYVDDEYVDNHDYDDDTDGDTDDDIDDDTDDDNDQKKDSYTAAGAAPDAGAAPTHTRPDQARLDKTRPGRPERESYEGCEVLHTTIRKLVTRSSVLKWSSQF